ncbi:rRNA-processing protein cgr1 [Ceratobasidium sp. 392]|nr:rRNA-processing protein cgr1 [Ceratobasidium sp. 392]
MSTDTQPAVRLASSSKGRVSGKAWKEQKTATKRSHLQPGVRAKSWEDRMRKAATDNAVKKLHKELVEEKAAEAAR